MRRRSTHFSSYDVVSLSNANATQMGSVEGAAVAQVRKGERGYTLVALVALMSIMALLLSAAAPNIKQQAEREREKEAIRRGEEVADAIRLYVQYRGALPTSIEQLLEGVPRGTKKIQILRPSAARDPLITSGDKAGEWRLVKPNSRTLIEFAQTVTAYAGGITPRTTGPQLLQTFAPQTAGLVTGLKLSTPSSLTDLNDNDGPFIGVMSRSEQSSVLTYYGADQHQQWVFTGLYR